MYKKLLSSLVLALFATACSGPDDSCDGASGSMQTEFVSFVGLDGDRVFFGFDKDGVSADEAKKLDKQIEWMSKNPSAKVTIEGHCDARGTSEYNIALGNRRAEAVKAYMVAKGISADRISTVSYGKERPAVVGSDEAAYAKNRRGVTIVVE
jgi:peptidoglycan-associated lipoprotein